MSARPELRAPDARPDVILDPTLADAPLRFRILTRISDDKLRSIPQQLEDCAGYVAGLQRDIAIDGIYNLGEHSGFSMTESEVYRQMLDDARNARFHGLVVRDTSRLGRDYWEKLGTLRDLRGAKLELHVVEDGGQFDFEDRIAKVKSWASTWADEEKKREEIRKAVRATDAIRDAGYPTVTPPYGYRAARAAGHLHNVWRAHEKEAAVVRACFQAVADGARLADVQREHGLTYAQLDRMLRNPSYTGGYLWRGELRRCAAEIVPPLVQPEVFAAVQARRGRPSR